MILCSKEVYAVGFLYLFMYIFDMNAILLR